MIKQHLTPFCGLKLHFCCLPGVECCTGGTCAGLGEGRSSPLSVKAVLGVLCIPESHKTNYIVFINLSRKPVLHLSKSLF